MTAAALAGHTDLGVAFLRPPAPATLVAPIIDGVAAQSVSPRTAASILSVSERTIRRWIAAGHLPARRLPTGLLTIRIADLDGLGDVAGP